MIIVADRQIPFIRSCCADVAEVRLYDARDRHTLTTLLRGADALFCRSTVTVDCELLSSTGIRFVGTATSGIDHVDVEWLTDHGIGFSSASGSNARSVAEYVICAILRYACATHRTLDDLSLGIIGVGKVGSLLSEFAERLGVKVFLNDPPRQDLGSDCSFSSLGDVLACDIVSLHVPKTQIGPYPTYDLINQTNLGIMQRHALLIQTSRGGTVNEHALIQHLRRGLIWGAVVDVFEHEPAVKTDLVKECWLASPHIAGHSFDAKIRGTAMLLEAFASYFGLGSEVIRAKSIHPTPHILQLSVGTNCIKEQALLGLLDQVYDIRCDDAALRAWVDESPMRLSALFAEYRANYNMRLEFPNYRVESAPGCEPLMNSLNDLGFMIHAP